MTPTHDLETAAFRRLRSHLSRRRLAQIELRLRLEMLLLGVLLGGFVLWQARAPFDGLSRQGGPAVVLAALGITGLAMALIAGGFVTARHAARLRRGPPGPEWMSLPISPRTLARHLAWDSSMMAGWLVFPAGGVWLAAYDLVPLPWFLAVAPVLVGALVAATAAGARLGEWIATRAPRSHPDLAPIHRVLSLSSPRPRRPRVAPALWLRQPTTVALMLKDVLVTRRVPSVGRQFLVAVVCWLLSVLAWGLPGSSSTRPLDYVAAFLMALLGSAALGEWLVSLSGCDPFAAVRVLPLGLRHVWSARFGLALLGVTVLLTAHAFGAHQLAPSAQRVFVIWVGGATLAIASLAVNYGVTLFPRADVAQRLLGLSLGLSVAASLMIPLLGWLVLLSAVVHSARRLPHWSRLEEV